MILASYGTLEWKYECYNGSWLSKSAAEATRKGRNHSCIFLYARKREFLYREIYDEKGSQTKAGA